MPEYLAPGVYVTEIASEAKPIEGVSTSTAGLIGSDTVAMLQQLVKHAPDWTEQNTHDPGVALLELLAWLAESLVYRTGRLPERGLLHAGHLAAAALTLVAKCDQPQGSVLKKVRFFEGRLLNEDDLRTEQDFLRPRNLGREI
ncbi:MAG TPA: hypothetical protein VM937_07620 [Burkholderiaceae bacterium]|jgi:phage tail sheath protein FI|nr:hypothetical protein [Burkholderiaceae bacterium]